MVTEEQKAQIKMCEMWLDVEFKGDINDPTEVESFLDTYLEDAECAYNDAASEFYSDYMW